MMNLLPAMFAATVFTFALTVFGTNRAEAPRPPEAAATRVDARVDEDRAGQASERPELPREWVWKREAVDFGSMYRQR